MTDTVSITSDIFKQLLSQLYLISLPRGGGGVTLHELLSYNKNIKW